MKRSVFERPSNHPANVHRYRPSRVSTRLLEPTAKPQFHSCERAMQPAGERTSTTLQAAAQTPRCRDGANHAFDGSSSVVSHPWAGARPRRERHRRRCQLERRALALDHLSKSRCTGLPTPRPGPRQRSRLLFCRPQHARKPATHPPSHPPILSTLHSTVPPYTNL